MNHKKIAILISGRGSTMLKLAQAMQQGKINGKICTIISNKSNAVGIIKAQKLNLPAKAIDKKSFAKRSDFEQELLKELQKVNPDLIVLAGFMHILGREIISHYYGKLINIHPSLLPKHPGLHAHRKVIEAGDKLHGLTIHYVNDQLDAGPVILQKAIKVLPNDTQDSLAMRLLEFEHNCLIEVVSWISQDRLYLNSDGQIQIDNKIITGGIKLSPQENIDSLKL